MSDVSFPIDHFVSKNNNKSHSAIIPNLNAPSENQEIKLLTQEILHILKANIGEEKFNTYFTNTFQISDIKPNLVLCLVTTPFIKKIIESQYLNNIKAAINDCLGKDYPIEITLDNSGGQNDYNSTAILHPSIVLKNEEHLLDDYQIQKGKTVKETSFMLSDAPIQTTNAPIPVVHHHNDYQQIDPKKHFDAFVVGPSNNLAHASAVAVAKNPGEIYQALYLYGNSGLGKTHLLHAIANHILQKNPSQRICITTATEFMSEMIHAIQEKAGFVYIEFTNSQGIQTKGWILKSDLSKI